MPTPVAVAKQCLTSEASHALDEAVAVARRRGHAQTTSLHAVSALLSLPSSALRDSAARSRSRLRFKTLELCLTVSLDRLPSTQLSDDPPVSNSLMAAIKRSQANQRRQPENFHLYHQISHPHPSSVSSVKVDLQHLILSILDDPVVSRVFAEAGFRSSEIKLAILRPPPPQLFRFSRGAAPVFLCNLTEQPDPGRRSSAFDENYRRIGEVLSRTRGRNPLLLGACAFDALTSFTEAVEKRKDGGVLPLELFGLRVICIGEQVSKFVTEKENSDDDKEGMRLTWNKISQMVEQCVGPGLVVNFGDLKCFVDDESGTSGEAVRYIVGELGKLLEFNYDKLWLMGAAASYDSYLRFVGKFPDIEKDWDLQLLPITSFRPSMIESYQKPKSSFMDSFVPFGGFFSSPADLKSSVNGSYYCVPHCHQCDERFEQEELAPSRVKLSASAPPSCQSKLPPWLHNPKLGSAKILNIKTIGDGVALDTEPEPHKKLDKTFQYHTQQFPDENTCQTFVGFESLNNKKEEADNNHSSKTTDASSSENIDLNSQVSKGEQMISTSPSSSPFSMVFKLKQEKLNSRLSEMFQKAEDLESGDLRSCNMSNSSMCDGIQMSPASVTSVTTELGLGLCSSHTTNKSKKLREEHIVSSFDLVNGNTFQHRAPSSSCLSSDFGGQVDMRNPKVLFEALSKKVGWQEEALRVIVRTLACCHTRSGKHHRANQRGDIWMNFVGPDKLGKKKIAVSLAEFLCGSQESFIFVDLKSEEMKGYDVNFRGKTTLDFIVGELCKKPLSVVFLENVDKADMVAQKSLSQAIKTGKMFDSHGREVGVNNSIFVTSFSILQNSSMPIREPSNYSEDRILRTKGWGMKIKVEHVIGDNSIKGIPNLVFINKRKLLGDNESHYHHKISETAKRAHKESDWVLDLNLPAEQNELQDMEDGNHGEDGSTENQNLWCQDLYDQVDETVVFKPYDFDALAERVLKVIRRNFHKILGSECLLQIESEVMEQLLAAAYVSDNCTEVEDWTDQVLSRAFAEVHRRYNPSAPSVVKLGTYQDQASGVCLPTKILVE